MNVIATCKHFTASVLCHDQRQHERTQGQRVSYASVM